MIWESKHWKDELLTNARALKKLESRRRTDRRGFQIERTVFVSAYIMRKLWEARKLSSAWELRQIPCVLHPPKERTPDRLSWHRIDEFYELAVSRSTPMSALEFCNRMIHSYVFMEVEGPRRTIEGFHFASDHTRIRGLCFVGFSDVIKLLRETGRDYPSSSHFVRHPKTGDWVIWAGREHPPNDWLQAAKEMRAGYVAKFLNIARKE